jgi:hypothetical protein
MSKPLILGFKDEETNRYFTGVYDPTSNEFDFTEVESKAQVDDWYLAHNIPPLNVVPAWYTTCRPDQDWVIDEIAQCINLVKRSPNTP